MFVIPVTRRTALNPQLTRAVDRFFDETLDRVLGRPADEAEPRRAPALDITETDTTYLAVVDLPGVAKEDLKVSIEGKRVAIEATVKAAKEQKDEKDSQRVLYRERSEVAYARKFTLPGDVDQAASSAKLEDGVLKLTLVKKTPAGAAQLTIS